VSIVLAVCVTGRRVVATVWSILFLISRNFSVLVNLLLTSQYTSPVHAMPVDAVADKLSIVNITTPRGVKQTARAHVLV